MKKKFDAVAFQRSIRQQLSREYIRNRKNFLQRIRDKHPLAFSEKA